MLVGGTPTRPSEVGVAHEKINFYSDTALCGNHTGPPNTRLGYTLGSGGLSCLKWLRAHC